MQYAKKRDAFDLCREPKQTFLGSAPSWCLITGYVCEERVAEFSFDSLLFLMCQYINDSVGSSWSNLDVVCGSI